MNEKYNSDGVRQNGSQKNDRVRPEDEDGAAFAIDVKRELSRALARVMREPIDPTDGIKTFDSKRFGRGYGIND